MLDWINPMAHIASLSSVLVLLLGLFLRNLLFAEYRVILGLVAIYVLADIISLLSSSNNLWLSHILTISEVVIFALVFTILQKNSREKRFIKFSACAFIVYWLVAKFTFESFLSPDAYTRPMGYLLVAAMGGLTIVRQSLPGWPAREFIPRIMIITAIFCYITGTLTLSLVLPQVVEMHSKTMLNFYFIAQWGSGILFNLCLLWGMIARWRIYLRHKGGVEMEYGPPDFEIRINLNRVQQGVSAGAVE